MVAAQKDRWSKAINAEGNAAKPLSKKYFFMKRKAMGGRGRPVRDMKMTGVTVENFQLRKAINGIIRAENTTREARKHATKSQKIEEMIGFAGTDQIGVFKDAQAQYGKWPQKAWIPIG
jgi:hypothetical protein